MGIETKSIGALIDELITCDMKCWAAQEAVMNAVAENEVAAAAKKAQETNARRNQLMRAIDGYFEDPNVALGKSYDASDQADGLSREELLEAHLTGLADKVLHPTDTVMTRGLAQAAWDYLIATGKEE